MLSRRLMPSIAELMAFEAVARLGSVTRAAEELALTQGALSKQIRQLEDTLQVRLFERRKRQILITPAGQSYVNEVRAVLAKLERSTRAVIEAGTEHNILRCAVVPAFAMEWLAPRIPELAAQHPGWDMNFWTCFGPFDFEEEKADAAILVGRADWPGTVSYRLFNENLIPVASPSYLRANPLERPSDLSRATLIQNTRRPALWNAWFEAQALNDDLPRPRYGFDEFSIIVEATCAGLGVALAPDFCVKSRIATGELVQLFGSSAFSLEPYSLITPVSTRASPMVTQFKNWLVNEFSQAQRTRGELRVLPDGDSGRPRSGRQRIPNNNHSMTNIRIIEHLQK